MNVTSFPIDPFLYEVDIPKCRFSQRIDSITMIIQEKRIRNNLMEVKPFKNDDGLHIRLCSIAENDSNKWFYVYVEFDASLKCAVERASISTDINELNCVILMKKAEHSRKSWPYVRIGPCKDTLSVVYLDGDAEIKKMNQDLFANYHSPHLPMHVSNPVCTPDKMTLTLKPGRDPKTEDSDNEDDEGVSEKGQGSNEKNSGKDGDSRKKPQQKYSKTAEEISALIQSGKIDEAIAKEIELEQEKELDELMMSKDDVTNASENYDDILDQDDSDSVYQLSETISKCRKLVSEKYFPKSGSQEFFAASDGYLLKTLESLENLELSDDTAEIDNVPSAENETAKATADSNQNDQKAKDQKATEVAKEDLSLELNPASDADNEKKADEDSSPREFAGNSSWQPKAQNKGGSNKQQNNGKQPESKSAKKKKKQQKNQQQRARLMSHSSDDETRANTYQNIENCKPMAVGSKQLKVTRQGSYDSSSATTSPAQSPRVEEAEGERGTGDSSLGSFKYVSTGRKGFKVTHRGRVSSVTEDDHPSSVCSSARPIIKRAYRSCAEQDEEDSEMEEDEGSLRKSVSFCEDVDVVNIKTTTTKAARKSTKKMKKRDRNRRGQQPEGGQQAAVANSDDEEPNESGNRQQVEVREQATWNKIPLSTVPLTFDLD